MTDEKLLNYYSTLNNLIELGNYEKVPKICTKILQEYPTEQEAFQCGLVAHIRQGKFIPALQMFVQFSKASKSFYYEQAYCHYRNNDIEKAHAILTANMSEFNVRDGELLAQIVYRLERFDECVDIYDKLLKNTQDEYQSERQVNMLAAVAGALHAGKVIKSPKFPTNTYELCFNHACTLMARNEHAQAAELLRKAEKLCVDAFTDEEEDNNEEFLAELNPIIVQLAVCYMELNRKTEANDLLARVRHSILPKDSLIAVVINNNLAVLKNTRVANHVTVKQYLASNMDQKLAAKLSAHQRKLLAKNLCLFQTHPCVKDINDRVMRDVVVKHPELQYLDVLARALVKIRKGVVQDAVTSVKTYLDANDEHRLFVSLVMVQTLLEKGELVKALDFLENLGEHKLRPGITAMLINLYQTLENYEAVTRTLTDTLNWYSERKDKLKSSMVEMFAKAAKFYIRHGQCKQAAKYLEDVLPSDPHNKTILALLVIAYTHVDAAKADEYLGLLPSEEAVDLSELQRMADEARFKKTSVKKRAFDPNTPDSRKSLRKRKRKLRLPKNYVEGVMPDPERWLPKYERSDFRRKRRNRATNKPVMKGSQGTVHKDTKNFDYSKREVTVTADTPPLRAKTSGGKIIKGKKKGGRR